ncbi:hypothetical protein [Nocardioides sambongensis]|uniref:hypothetical protein n=1 Tax=Nocardioides sambongensis TaxID=2589074 RepID=UPI00112D0343|nr:hypothetical protein [Nocardioides sambongensis]
MDGLGRVYLAIVGPYASTYVVLSLVLTRSLNTGHGLSFAVFAALVAITMTVDWRTQWRPSASARRRLGVASAVLGGVVALVVAQLTR